jgi:hypothetical protein
MPKEVVSYGSWVRMFVVFCRAGRSCLAGRGFLPGLFGLRHHGLDHEHDEAWTRGDLPPPALPSIRPKFTIPSS